MDYSRLDPVRRSVTPIQLDLVESFANGRITRRQFIKRASVIGLSLSSVAAVIAACGPGTPSATTAPASPGASASAGASPSGSALTGGTIRCAIQRPVSVDPVAMQDLGGYGIVAQSFEFLCAQRPIRRSGRISPRAWRPSGSPNDDGTRLDVQAAAGGQVAARRLAASRRTTSSRRWNASWRPATPASRASSARAAPWRPIANTVTFTLEGGQRELPVPRLDLQRADGHHPEGLRRRHDRRRASRPGPAPGSSLNYNVQHRRDLRAKPGLVGWPDAARRHRVHLLRRDRADDHRLPGRPGRRDRPVRRPLRRRAVQRPELHAHRRSPRRSIARSGCAWTRAQFADVEGPRGARADVGPAGARPAAVPGSRGDRQRPRHLAGLPVLRLGDRRSGRGTSSGPRRCLLKPAPAT